MNKKMREIKAQMDVLKEEATEAVEAKDIETAESKIAEIDNLEREYKVAERLFNGEKEGVTDKVVETAKVVDKVSAFATAIKKVRNSMNENTGTDGGYTVPEDVQTDIEHLREAKFSLESLVSVESVSTMSGRRTFKKRSSQTGFNKVGEGAAIGQGATPKYDVINYEIEKYAGILPVTNELFEDSDANIYNELTQWIADESRVTRNKAILAAINTKAQVALAGLDDIKKALNVTLGQAFKATSVIVTNDDGLQYLDTLKDKDKELKREILFIKNDLNKISAEPERYKLVITAYKNRLLELGSIKKDKKETKQGKIENKKPKTKETKDKKEVKKIEKKVKEENGVAKKRGRPRKNG